MDDITTRLADLHDGTPPAASDAVVTADVRRGRRALGRRRVRIGVAASAATLVAAGALTAGLTHNSTASHASVDSRSIQLVDYTGTQPHGFDVTQVPDGWVLKDSTPNYLDIAEPADNTDGSVFVNKLVVMLESVDETGAPQGAPVTVNGHPGAIADSDGTKTLRYSDGTHRVEIQAWSNLRWSNDQLVAFAEGVTVTSAAVPGRG